MVTRFSTILVLHRGGRYQALSLSCIAHLHTTLTRICSSAATGTALF
jgi:hypothetical protein